MKFLSQKWAPFLAVLVCLRFAVCWADASDDPVRTELISSIDTVRAGQSFLIGVLFKIAPGWHIYWKYSGDAGLPTDVSWSVPKGWSVGPLLWPLPQRFTEKGPLTTYGYVDSVLLMAQVTAPPHVEESVSATISAVAGWLMCRQSCLPGKATLTISLPVVRPSTPTVADDPNHKSTFDRWSSQLSRQADSSGWLVTASLKKGSSSRTVQVTLYFNHVGISPSHVFDWFPAPGDDFGVMSVRLHKEKDDTKVTFLLQSYTRDFVPGDKLESLLLYPDSSGVRRGAQIETPVSFR